jgi:hypothetical protein
MSLAHWPLPICPPKGVPQPRPPHRSGCTTLGFTSSFLGSSQYHEPCSMYLRSRASRPEPGSPGLPPQPTGRRGGARAGGGSALAWGRGGLRKMLGLATEIWAGCRSRPVKRPGGLAGTARGARRRALTRDVHGAAGVKCVVVDGLGALVGVDVAVDHDVDTVLRGVGFGVWGEGLGGGEGKVWRAAVQAGQPGRASRGRPAREPEGEGGQGGPCRAGAPCT